mmetsp:Transcript_10806/g.22866  ORF Transcript_10806/g.22866 Transcript_10806/m.22866 type:complete len:277 (+) Transcript_10806:2446-3276(+)
MAFPIAPWKMPRWSECFPKRRKRRMVTSEAASVAEATTTSTTTNSRASSTHRAMPRPSPRPARRHLAPTKPAKVECITTTRPSQNVWTPNSLGLLVPCPRRFWRNSIGNAKMRGSSVACRAARSWRMLAGRRLRMPGGTIRLRDNWVRWRSRRRRKSPLSPSSSWLSPPSLERTSWPCPMTLSAKWTIKPFYPPTPIVERRNKKNPSKSPTLWTKSSWMQTCPRLHLGNANNDKCTHRRKRHRSATDSMISYPLSKSWRQKKRPGQNLESPSKCSK